VRVLTGIREDEAGSGGSSAARADTPGALPEEADVGLGGGDSVAPDGRGAAESLVEDGAEEGAEDVAEAAESVGVVPGASHWMTEPKTERKIRNQ
jgi:hypothetical protein